MKAHVTILDPQKAYKKVIENADLTEVSMYLAYRYFVMQMMEELVEAEERTLRMRFLTVPVALAASVRNVGISSPKQSVKIRKKESNFFFFVYFIIKSSLVEKNGMSGNSRSYVLLSV